MEEVELSKWGSDKLLFEIDGNHVNISMTVGGDEYSAGVSMSGESLDIEAVRTFAQELIAACDAEERG